MRATRRGFLAALAALPVVGSWLAKAEAAPAYNVGLLPADELAALLRSIPLPDTITWADGGTTLEMGSHGGPFVTAYVAYLFERPPYNQREPLYAPIQIGYSTDKKENAPLVNRVNALAAKLDAAIKANEPSGMVRRWPADGGQL